jgi:murein DD-endopeptidase MepM/ murein hydrolase activator NlpD
MSTGVHLHWEIWKGRDHGWSADGSGFVEPIEFTKALIQAEKAKNFAKEATPEDAPVADDGIREVKKAAPKASAKAVAKKPATPTKKPVAKKATGGGGSAMPQQIQ